ncbi:inositol hexakisphosphate and diphosphoinositol-pentakisphosphate kinase 2-like isoform X1 [Saccostrea echinata]|uniref:inositol hexakisphosphate and diphosphoinositol-pentakisphosphate kinase 2-like isoform X1 n=1 Tax=Saccostrea echinata TaxID=191078 RepID=UPI002A82EF1C|nr:inositol hexakisphosphate and diphosphoinositol-pentakisphosphate kinase 2-like isoform X1 [Saccostrea echinata]XP_061176480.1 inositol hexakisphosphate and diphosphoinositol-pentakisphosphate kinase 2-like isoform X1 [Saccostrea echinata]
MMEITEENNPSRSPLNKDGAPMFFVGEDILIKGKGENALFEELPEGKRIILGVCAMQKKSNSKPMHEIIDRLEKFMQIQATIFDEDVILNKPIEEWPIVDVLISFFSAGFPLDKAIQYTKLRQPFVINDLESQYILLDRREVYKTLFQNEILHPRYTVLNRKEDDSTESQVVISDDTIEVDGETFHKPFVEKPVSAEDHNIIIYFPQSAGGGSQKLFRKVHDGHPPPPYTCYGLWNYLGQDSIPIGSRSSVYSHHSRLRKTGSYIYEDFMPTDGTDVKVYTVGPDYVHAEARKSPALDGKVERDEHGKEVRYPVLLSAKEKMLARKVSLAFKQTVCGFDLLRANGKSYVCDVNGFSFVKNSTKYYDDCAKILGTMIMRALAPQLHIPWLLGSAPEDIPVVPTTSGSMMELRTVVAVIRHGDRTPKQKMKMEVKHRKFFELFEKYDGYRKGHLKLKKPKQLQEVLDIARFLLSENEASQDPEICEKKVKLQQLKLVLEMYGHFSGINRKVQLKYQPFGHRKSKRSSSEDDDVPHPPSLLLIVKWGGELTPAGKVQAEELGKAFRTLYPGGQGQFETPGLGFLRLHSTFRHDLKIYASDEGRVQMTAAAFTKGLLALEGELPPILVQMVKSANTNGLLDKQGETSKYQQVVKERLTQMLNEDRDFSGEDYEKLAPTNSESLIKALDFIKNPGKLCEHVYAMVKELTAKIRTLKLEHRTRDLKLYHGESWELLIRRWAKLEKDFKMKGGRFDVSKIPDIYDCIKYDLQHNQKTIQYERAKELFECSKALADIVIPQEYGITLDEKLHISQSVCTPLMRKIRSDLEQCVCPDDEEESTRLNSLYSLGVASPERFVRTRLYFTSESHIHSLLNMLRYGGLRDEASDEQWKKAMDFINNTPELNYMSQIIVMMFEDPSKGTSSERFHVELHFSPGAYSYGEKGFHYPLVHSRSMAYKNSNNPLMKLDVAKELSEERKLYKHGHYEWSKSPKDYQNRPVSAPMIIQEQEELEEADIFEHAHNSVQNSEKVNSNIGADQGDHSSELIKESKFTLEPVKDSKFTLEPVKESKFKTELVKESKFVSEPVKESKFTTVKVPEQKSPKCNPDIPEWDWGSDPEHEEEKNLQEKPASLPIASVSEPIEIQSPNSNPDLELSAVQEAKSRVRFSGPEPVRSQSLEEKRSKSLEDKPAEPKVDRHSLYDRHYLTVHLPLASDKRRNSCSSLFYLNPEAFKENYIIQSEMNRARSASVLGPSNPAFEGFNMVPSLHPLETLHNKLTMKELDDFLKRATTCKFVTPISSPPYSYTPLASPHIPVTRAQKGNQSSSNSSTGPSSPVSGMGSLVLSRLQEAAMYIFQRQDSNQEDQTS